MGCKSIAGLWYQRGSRRNEIFGCISLVSRARGSRKKIKCGAYVVRKGWWIICKCGVRVLGLLGCSTSKVMVRRKSITSRLKSMRKNVS